MTKNPADDLRRKIADLEDCELRHSGRRSV
jgi:hypothetical protein